MHIGCEYAYTGAQTPDVSNYLINGLLQSYIQFDLQRMNIIISVMNYYKYQ